MEAAHLQGRDLVTLLDISETRQERPHRLPRRLMGPGNGKGFAYLTASERRWGKGNRMRHCEGPKALDLLEPSRSHVLITERVKE